MHPPRALLAAGLAALLSGCGAAPDPSPTAAPPAPRSPRPHLPRRGKMAARSGRAHPPLRPLFHPRRRERRLRAPVARG